MKEITEDEILNILLGYFLILFFTRLILKEYIDFDFDFANYEPFAIYTIAYLFLVGLYYFHKRDLNAQGSFIKGKRYKPSKDIRKIIDNFHDGFNTSDDFKKNFNQLKIVVNQSNKKEKINLNNYVIRTDRNYSEFDFFNVGVLKYSINPNHPREAIINISNAIKERPNRSIYYLCRGFILQESGDAENAYSDFKKACILGDFVALDLLLFGYETRIVEELNTCIEKDENSIERIEFESFVASILEKYEEDCTHIGIDESGKILLIDDNDNGFLLH